VKPKPSGTVRKAFQLLDELSRAGGELAARDLARLTGLDRTTVYRLLETLTEIGVVARDPPTARYRLGLRTLDYANGALDMLEVHRVAVSHLIDLEREMILDRVDMDCNIFVGVLDGPDVVLVEIGRPRSAFGPVGARMRFPASASAAGRCMLAYMPEAQREHFLTDVPLEARTPRTLTTREQIEERLGQIRTLGYDVSDREVFPDLVALGVPVLSRAGTALASIGVSGPAMSTTVDKLVDRFADKLMVAAQRTGLALRHRD